MKVLIVEDRQDNVKDIISHCKEQGWMPELISFDAFDDSLTTFNPDVIVLDWKDDISGEIKGEEIFRGIWENGFKPVIIFSAYAGGIDLPEEYRKSNLIYLQPKGDEQPVINYLDTISGFVPVITGLKNEFNDALIQALNSIKMMSKAMPVSPNIMRYVFAKRVSNFFDKECSGETPPAWIQYTYPPISDSLCVSDILRSIPPEGDVVSVGAAEEYWIILSPSCDLAHGKAPHVLCAQCYSKDHFYKNDRDYRCLDEKERPRYLASKLNSGYNSRWIALPNIPEVLPYLTVDLKKVYLLPFDKISLYPESINSEHHGFCRVASVDSPYREQIVWAHMINSCRPGVPDRNIEDWVKELMV